MKERAKAYSGQLVAVGSKQEIHENLNTLEVESLKKRVSEPVASTIDPEPMPANKTSKKQGMINSIIH